MCEQKEEVGGIGRQIDYEVYQLESPSDASSCEHRQHGGRAGPYRHRRRIPQGGRRQARPGARFRDAGRGSRPDRRGGGLRPHHLWCGRGASGLRGRHDLYRLGPRRRPARGGRPGRCLRPGHGPQGRGRPKRRGSDLRCHPSHQGGLMEKRGGFPPPQVVFLPRRGSVACVCITQRFRLAPWSVRDNGEQCSVHLLIQLTKNCQLFGKGSHRPS